MSFQDHRYSHEVCIEGETTNNPGDVVRFTLVMDGLALCAMQGCGVAIIVMGGEFYQHRDCPISTALDETFGQ